MRTAFALGIVLATLASACGGTQDQVRREPAVEPPAPLTLPEEPPSAPGAGTQQGQPGPQATPPGPGGPAEPSVPTSPWQANFVRIDLMRHGFPVAMRVPEGATMRAEFGALKVEHGPRFQLELYGHPADLAARKREIENSGMYRFRRYVVDAPDTLVYTVQAADGSGVQEYHFVANVTVDGRDYRCEDTAGVAYTEGEVRAMLDACQSMTGR